MAYVDGFVLVVPTKNLAAYKRMAAKAGKIWIEHGALEYRECKGEDVASKIGNSFPDITLAKRSDTVVFAYVRYASRAHRDEVVAKVMADARLKGGDAKSMPFDPKRMSYGGFETMVEFTAAPQRAPAKKSKRAAR